MCNMKIDRLHYISQKPAIGTQLDAVLSVLEAGGNWIQLRVKGLPYTEILDLAIECKNICDRFGARLIVNDHPQIAVEVGAYGLHLGLSDMQIREARAITGPEMIIGGTANTIEHILQRVAEGADYVGLGPYRFTRTKENLSPIIGLDGYLAIMEQLRERNIAIPIIAIGGITDEDVPDLMHTGLYGVAVSSALTNRQDTQGIINDMYYNLKINNYVNNSR